MEARSAFQRPSPETRQRSFPTLPDGRVKSLWGIHLFGFVLMHLMPDPVALRGLNSYSRFSSRAMARATASASTSTSLSLKRMTFQPMDSRCLCRFTSFSTTLS